MVTLRHDGFRKVREGVTTIEEVLHVVGEARDVTCEDELNALQESPLTRCVMNYRIKRATPAARCKKTRSKPTTATKPLCSCGVRG